MEWNSKWADKLIERDDLSESIKQVLIRARDYVDKDDKLKKDLENLYLCFVTYENGMEFHSIVDISFDFNEKASMWTLLKIGGGGSFTHYTPTPKSVST